MNEENDEVIFYINGEERYDEDLALAILLKESILFSNEASFSYTFEGKIYNEKTTGLFVNCNDIFAWGCADAENLPYDQISILYKMWKDDNKWGFAKWCCKIRNQQPQSPVKKDMIKDGSWDEEMDKLSANS